MYLSWALLVLAYIYTYTQLRFKDHTGPLSLALFHRCYTLCGYKRGWCREEEEKILTGWQQVCTQRIVVVWAQRLCRVKIPCTSIHTHWPSIAHCQEKPRFLLCICGCSLGQIYSNNCQCSLNPAEAERFLTSAWPWVSHLTSLCLGPSGWKLGRNTWPDVVCEPGIPKSAI